MISHEVHIISNEIKTRALSEVFIRLISGKITTPGYKKQHPKYPLGNIKTPS